MNNNNRMIYSLVLSGILILVGVKLIKTPTAKLVKYTGFGMAFAGVSLLILEFTQNQKSIIDSALATIRMQTVVAPSPMPSRPSPAKSPAQSPAQSPAKSPAQSPAESPTESPTESPEEPLKNPGAAFFLTLLIIAMGLTFIL